MTRPIRPASRSDQGQVLVDRSAAGSTCIGAASDRLPVARCQSSERAVDGRAAAIGSRLPGVFTLPGRPRSTARRPWVETGRSTCFSGEAVAGQTGQVVGAMYAVRAPASGIEAASVWSVELGLGRERLAHQRGRWDRLRDRRAGQVDRHLARRTDPLDGPGWSRDQGLARDRNGREHLHGRP
jgi:hypothetical protein